MFTNKSLAKYLESFPEKKITVGFDDRGGDLVEISSGDQFKIKEITELEQSIHITFELDY